MTGLTAEMVVDMRALPQPRISPDGATVASVVAPLGRTGDHPVSEMWIASSNGSSAARRFTAGTAHNIAPRWSHDSEWLFVLSGRANRGTLDLSRVPMRGGESERLTIWTGGIAGFQVLPDDKQVILTASDPKTEEVEKKAKEKNDIQVFGQMWRPSRLRLLTIVSKAISAAAPAGKASTRTSTIASAPMSFAHAVKTPVLILHRGNDTRVPASQGRLFARAPRHHGCAHELVVYPREPHGMQERLHQIDLLNR